MYGRVMFTILVAAVVINLVFRFMEDRRRYHADRSIGRAQVKLSREYALILGNVLSVSRMLQCLAATWGDPPETVRVKLLEALRVPEGPDPALEDRAEGG